VTLLNGFGAFDFGSNDLKWRGDLRRAPGRQNVRGGNTDAALDAQVKREARGEALRKAADREIESRAAATK
jgi:hypothetical protein